MKDYLKSIEALRTIFTMLEPLLEGAQGDQFGEVQIRRRGTVYDDVYQQLDLVEEELIEPQGAGGIIASDDDDETQIDGESLYQAGNKSVARASYVENNEI